eukprot:COSAG04_NODE_2017_length_4993_cov_2.174908_1_plen_582_part_10
MAEDNDLPQLGYAGWRDDKWESWSSDEMAGFLRNQSMHFVHGATAKLEGRNATCCSGTPVECQPLECYGSCFVHSLPQSQLDYYSTLIDKVRSAGTGALTLMYHESYVSAAAPFASSSEASKAGAAQIDTGDTVNQSDSRLLDVDGSQVAYATCAAGRDYPLFYPTTANAHGRVLEAYFRKALSLGFDGVYHDDSGFNYYYPYTFDQWDRVSGYLDPVTLRPKALMGHVTLLSQEQEIRLAEIVKQANGVMVLNDQPMTRTLREYAQHGGVAGGRGGANLHFIEGSQEARMQSTHLHTNVALLRYGQQLVDRDPKYNKTCQLCVPGSDHHLPGCVWRNVLDHLDYGVLPYLYDGLFPRSQAPNILAQLYPITVLEIGPGLVRGKDRIVTRHPGVSYGFGPGVALDVYTYDKGVLLNVSHHVTGPVAAGFNADTAAAVLVRSTPETLKTDDAGEPSTCGIDSGAPRYGNPFAFYDQLTVQSGSPPWPAAEATIGERRGITAHSRFFQMVGQRWWCSVPGCNGTWPEADIFSLFPSIADGWNFSSCADLESPLILNGGVPQRAPLAEQLARIDKLIATWLPDPE